MNFLTKKQMTEALFEVMSPYDRMGSPSLINEKIELMWRMNQSFGAELIGSLNGHLIYGFDGIPTGSIRSENVTKKSSGESVPRFTVTSPFIEKQRGERDAVKSGTVKGVLSRLDSKVIKPASIISTFAVNVFPKFFHGIGTTSFSVSNVPIPSFQEYYEFLIDNINVESKSINVTLPQSIVDWTIEARKRIQTTKERFNESEITRRAFFNGFYIFAHSKDIRHLDKPILMMKFKFREGSTQDIETVSHRRIDSINEIGDECPHILGLNNLMRLNTEFSSGIIPSYEGTQVYKYNQTYGILRGACNFNNLGHFNMAVVPVNPVSNDTDRPKTGHGVVESRKLSELFGD
jgi:hypothetical protein